MFSYLEIAEKQFEDPSYSGNYNIGPDDRDCITTGELDRTILQFIGGWSIMESNSDKRPHEANFLKLDCSKMKKVFQWKPAWHVETAVEKTIEWSKAYLMNENVSEIMDETN